jgi:hypothetical protein
VFPTRVTCVAMTFAFVGLASVPGGPAFGADEDRAAFNSWLNNVLGTVPSQIRPQKIIPIEDEALQKILPGDRFYGVYYATWPRPPYPTQLPKELSSTTVVSVRHGEPIQPIRDEEALTAFLPPALPPVKDEAQANDALLASLRLAEAVSKAGSAPFEKPQVSIVREGDGIVATGQATAQAPARGEVAVRLEFGADGRIKPEGIKIEDRSRPGPPS